MHRITWFFGFCYFCSFLSRASFSAYDVIVFTLRTRFWNCLIAIFFQLDASQCRNDKSKRDRNRKCRERERKKSFIWEIQNVLESSQEDILKHFLPEKNIAIYGSLTVTGTASGNLLRHKNQ